MSRDWTSKLFYRGDSYPSLLPSRFKLPSGLSRYSSDCTLADIHLAGFSGPVSDPPFVDQLSQKVIWNADTESWEVIDNPDFVSVQAEQESFEVAESLKLQMSQCLSCDVANLTPKYKQKLAEYLGLCYILVHKYEVHKQFIAWADVPEPPSAFLSDLEVLTAYQKAWFDENIDDIRQQYETQGLVGVPSVIDISNFWDHVPVPSSWVVGTQPIVPSTMRSSYILPSGYILDERCLFPSGYYYVSTNLPAASGVLY